MSHRTVVGILQTFCPLKYLFRFFCKCNTFRCAYSVVKSKMGFFGPFLVLFLFLESCAETSDGLYRRPVWLVDALNACHHYVFLNEHIHICQTTLTVYYSAATHQCNLCIDYASNKTMVEIQGVHAYASCFNTKTSV